MLPKYFNLNMMSHRFPLQGARGLFIRYTTFTGIFNLLCIFK